MLLSTDERSIELTRIALANGYSKEEADDIVERIRFCYPGITDEMFTQLCSNPEAHTEDNLKLLRSSFVRDVQGAVAALIRPKVPKIKKLSLE